jgi:hypothetical protein
MIYINPHFENELKDFILKQIENQIENLGLQNAFCLKKTANADITLLLLENEMNWDFPTPPLLLSSKPYLDDLTQKMLQKAMQEDTILDVIFIPIKPLCFLRTLLKIKNHLLLRQIQNQQKKNHQLIEQIKKTTENLSQKITLQEESLFSTPHYHIASYQYCGYNAPSDWHDISYFAQKKWSILIFFSAPRFGLTELFMEFTQTLLEKSADPFFSFQEIPALLEKSLSSKKEEISFFIGIINEPEQKMLFVNKGFAVFFSRSEQLIRTTAIPYTVDLSADDFLMTSPGSILLLEEKTIKQLFCLQKNLRLLITLGLEKIKKLDPEKTYDYSFLSIQKINSDVSAD